MPYFITTFWDKKLTGITHLKDISWKEKKLETIFLPERFWARKIVEIIQFLLHCYHHISEENAPLEMIFWSMKSSEKQIFGYIFWTIFIMPPIKRNKKKKTVPVRPQPNTPRLLVHSWAGELLWVFIYLCFYSKCLDFTKDRILSKMFGLTKLAILQWQRKKDA